MSPSDIEEVVADAEEADGLQRDDGREVGCELVGVSAGYE